MMQTIEHTQHNVDLRSTSEQPWVNVEVEVIEKVDIIFSWNVSLIREGSNCPWCCGIQTKKADQLSDAILTTSVPQETCVGGLW